MTRDERQAEAAAYIALCERVGEKMVLTGIKIEQLTDAELGRMFVGDELIAAKFLRKVAERIKKTDND